LESNQCLNNKYLISIIAVAVAVDIDVDDDVVIALYSVEMYKFLHKTCFGWKLFYESVDVAYIHLVLNSFGSL